MLRNGDSLLIETDVAFFDSVAQLLPLMFFKRSHQLYNNAPPHSTIVIYFENF